MKYNQLIVELKGAGCILLRHGGRHDVWLNPTTGQRTVIPRHGSKEIPPGTLKSIYRKLLGR